MKTINIIQIISEVLVAIGFLVGLIPFGYLIALYWVAPLTILNLILAIVSKNKTLPFTITNVFMAWLSLIPILGYLTRIIGVIMSILSIVKIEKVKK
jgi:hypothetical protein